VVILGNVFIDEAPHESFYQKKNLKITVSVIY
jgi:hypothetical protein